MGKPDLNVLFTGVGRRVELLRGFTKAAAAGDGNVRMIGTDRDPLAPAIAELDLCYQVPPSGGEDHLQKLRKIIRHEEIHVIFPLIDPDVHALSAHRMEFEELGVAVCTVAPHAAEIVTDKFATYEHFRGLGLTTPKTWLPAVTDQAELPDEVFIKDRRGSGSKGARSTSSKLLALPQMSDQVIQEIARGPEITTDVFFDLEGDLIGHAQRRRIATRGGEVAKAVTVNEPDVTEGAIAIGHSLGAVGAINVQAIITAEGPCFIEVNGRFGGGSPLAFHAGVDAPFHLLSHAAGKKPRLAKPLAARPGVYMTRYDESLFMEEHDLGAALRDIL